MFLVFENHSIFQVFFYLKRLLFTHLFMHTKTQKKCTSDSLQSNLASGAWLLEDIQITDCLKFLEVPFKPMKLPFFYFFTNCEKDLEFHMFKR